MNDTIPKPSSDLLVEIRSAWTFFGTSEFAKILRDIGSVSACENQIIQDSDIYELLSLILKKKQHAEFIYFLKKHKKTAKESDRYISDENLSLLIRTVSEHFEIPEIKILNSVKGQPSFNAYLCVVVILRHDYNLKNEEIARIFKKTATTIYNNLQVFLDLDRRNQKDIELLDSIRKIKQKLNLATT